MESKKYKTFFIMLSISFLIMYSVMYLNVDKPDHIYLSVNRLYMALLMVSPMALVMLGMMRNMYKNKKTNRVIILSSILIFVIALVLLRTQTPINDIQYMKAMIPHHSSAILNSQEVNIKDPEVVELSKQIIESQEEEIQQMKSILQRLQ
jgi:uncharacterized protein (DUF305 family)